MGGEGIDRIARSRNRDSLSPARGRGWREGARRNFSNIARAAFVFLALLALAPAATAERTDREVIDAFVQIAFGNEFERIADPRLAKWLQPLLYVVVETEPLAAHERGYLAGHMARLAALTRLDMRAVEDRVAANFEILLVAQSDYETAVERRLAPSRRHLLTRFAATNCIGFLRRHRWTHEIRSATVIIPVDSARKKDLLTACIAEETTQVLGLLNDSDQLADSLFNDHGDARDLTPLDELLLQILYHPKLAPGMRPDEARAALPDVLREIRRATAAQ